MKTIAIFLFISQTLFAECVLPSNLKEIAKKVSLKTLKNNKDVLRNTHSLKKLCLYQVAFDEGKYHWRMLLVTHPKQSKGAFWYLPHDDEDTAFDAAIYATQKYGGGFLAVMSGDQRSMQGQDPNRNFGETQNTAATCKNQHFPAVKYSKNVFKIIDTFRHSRYPYLALHNNKNSWYGNGGSGGVSILKSSKTVHSYPAAKQSRLQDEDNLLYMAGKSKTPNAKKLQHFLGLGLNVKYEIIDTKHNDCSLSNYVVLKKNTTDYINIEAEHGDIKTQKMMIDKILKP